MSATSAASPATMTPRYHQKCYLPPGRLLPPFVPPQRSPAALDTQGFLYTRLICCLQIDKDDDCMLCAREWTVQISDAGLGGTFKGMEAKLQHIADAGFTALQLMPVLEYSGSWGYNPRLLFPTHEVTHTAVGSSSAAAAE